MGSLFIGNCSCGYESERIYHGAGMSGGEPCDDIPVVCLVCEAVFAADVRSATMPKCTACGSTDVLPTMRMVRSEGESWMAEPIAGMFPCPKCKCWTMTISKGLWD